MASGFAFTQLVMNWSAADLYEEYKRFKEHATFVFSVPRCKAEKAEKAGCNWLGIWIGPEGREVYKTLSWAEGEKEDPDKVLEKLNDYIKLRKNRRIARFRFHQHAQKEGEAFNNFVKDLRLLAMDCQFTDTDDLLIDAIIIGIREKKVQEKSLNEGDGLTLTKSIQIARQYELSQLQLREMRGEESKVAGIQTQSSSTKSRPRNEIQRQTPESSMTRVWKKPHTQHSSSTCTKCGKEGTHSRTNGKYPAVGARCSYCNKKPIGTQFADKG